MTMTLTIIRTEILACSTWEFSNAYALCRCPNIIYWEATLGVLNGCLPNLLGTYLLLGRFGDEC